MKFVDTPAVHRLQHFVVREIIMDGSNGYIIVSYCRLIEFESRVALLERSRQPIVFLVCRIPSYVKRVIPYGSPLTRDNDTLNFSFRERRYVYVEEGPFGKALLDDQLGKFAGELGGIPEIRWRIGRKRDCDRRDPEDGSFRCCGDCPGINYADSRICAVVDT